MRRLVSSSWIMALGGAAAALGAACVDSRARSETDSAAAMPEPGGGSRSAGGASSVGSAPPIMTPPSNVPTGALGGPDACSDPPPGQALTGAGYTWQNVTILGGGFVSGIEFSRATGGDDVVYARTDVGGAYRWDPNATRWTPLTDWVGRDDANLMGIESIAPDPVDPDVVYVAAGEYTSTNGAILRSTDRGGTFQEYAFPLPMGGNADGRNVGERLAVDPNLTSTLYFAARSTRAGGGLFRSTDSGATWSRVTSFPVTGPSNYGLSFVAFDPRSGAPDTGVGSSILYVGVSPAATAQTGPSLYRTTDAGATWQEVPGDPQGQYPQHAALDETTGMMYLTYDNASGPNNVTMGAVWKLDTSSDTWKSVSPPGTKGGFGGVSVDAETADAVVVSTIDRWPDEIYRSTNGGGSWTAIGSKASRNLNGAEWLYFGGTSLSTTGWAGDIEIDPHRSGRVLYNTGQGIWWSDDVTAASLAWTFQDQGLEETVALGLVSPSGGSAPLLSAVGDLGGFRHEDLTRPPSAGMYDAPVFGNTTGLDYAELRPALVVRVGTNTSHHGAYSTDGGITWQAFATEPVGTPTAGSGSIAVSADGQTFVWAPQNTTPARSTDRGATWTTAAGLPNGAMLASDRVDPNTFYATAGGALYVSADGGATFAASKGGALPKGTSTARPVFGHQGDVWLATPSGLYHSTDAGATLTPLGTVQIANAVGVGLGATCSAYPVLYLSGRVNDVSGIFRSDDQAATWTRIDDPQHQFGSIGYVSGDPRRYGRVYLGSGGRGILYGDPVSP